MTTGLSRIGFGGGCHWCTEAVFQVLQGVRKVEQGFIASAPPYDSFSEAVIAHYNRKLIPLKVLIEIHLRTHASTSRHKLRGKYRSAIYVFDEKQDTDARDALGGLQPDFTEPLVTQILPFVDFKPSDAFSQNYYATRPQRPFCRNYIDPKLALLRKDYAERLRAD